MVKQGQELKVPQVKIDFLQTGLLAFFQAKCIASDDPRLAK